MPDVAAGVGLGERMVRGSYSFSDIEECIQQTALPAQEQALPWRLDFTNARLATGS
jgi:hypothetical protein